MKEKSFITLTPGLTQYARAESARSVERRRPDRRVRRVRRRGAVVHHERHEQHRQLLVAVAVDVVELAHVAARSAN
jgi:hypothetical protein